MQTFDLSMFISKKTVHIEIKTKIMSKYFFFFLPYILHERCVKLDIKWRGYGKKNEVVVMHVWLYNANINENR